MFKKIMVPVDLEQQSKLSGALSVAAKMAETFGAELLYTSVHGGGPSMLAHTEAEHRAILQDFVDGQRVCQVCKTTALPLAVHDKPIDLAPALIEAATEHNVDLIVMNSHIPGWAEHVFHSNAGYVACHAPISVFVVR